MKYLILILLMVGTAFAQFKPSQVQYLINQELLINGGFEQGFKAWTNGSGIRTVDTGTKLVGNASGKVTLSNQTFDIKQSITNIAYSGVQMEASCAVKSSETIYLCSLLNDVEIACNASNAEDAWEYLNISVMAPSSSGMGLKLKSSGVITDTVNSDDCKFRRISRDQVCWVKDVKGKGTNGGTFNAGVPVQRDLTATEGDCDFLTLDSNQITLLYKGKYHIEGEAVAEGPVNLHQAAIYDITNSVNLIDGTSESNNTSQVINQSTFSGVVNSTGVKIIELQHECQTTVTTVGFGRNVGGSGAGDDNLYSWIKIIKRRD